MDPHVHRALHMREQLKQIYRARLPHMGWCDDNTRRKQQVEAAYSQVRGDWEAEAGQHQSVAAAALEASSTDNEHQTIDLTLANDRSFWSSSGHPSSIAHEALLYELAGPACRVVSIKLAPYRALYQDGYPVYPPMRLQVWVGASPYTLQPASPWHDVQASDALQTFALWPHAPIGRYLQVRMYGKLQKQREDMQFYVAIRHVDATGAALSTLELLAVQPLLRSNTLQLPATASPGVPATCSSALQAAADYGLGPEQAVHSAAAKHLQDEQQQGSGQGQRSQLVVRRRALRQAQAEQDAGRVAEQQPAPPLPPPLPQQQQQQGSAVQRVTAGLRTILGRRGAEAAAVPGLSEAGPSKRLQQQQPQPAPQPPPLPAHHPQQQNSWQGLALWLADDSAAALAYPIQDQQESAVGQAAGTAAGEHPHHHHHQQQQQGSHGGHAEGLDMSGSDSGSLGSDSEDEQAAGGQQQQQYEQQYRAFRGEGSDGDEEEGEGEEGEEQPAAQLHLGPAELEAAQRLTHQIAVRLQAVPPWQQEQVLAELLADEPLGGRAGRQAYRQHLADLQEQLRQQQQQQQQQQQGETVQLEVAAHAPPVISIFSGSNNSSSSSCTDTGINSSSGGGSSWSEVPDFGSQDCDLVVKARGVLDQQFATALGFEIDSMVEAVAGVDEDELRLRQRYAASYHVAAVTHAALRGSAAAEAGGGSAGTETAAAAAAGGCGIDGGGGADRMQQGGEAGAGVPDFQSFGGMWGSAGTTAPQDPPAGEALPVLTAADMLVWQAPQSGHTRSSSSSSSSTKAWEQQQQWLSPASCFCEGLV